MGDGGENRSIRIEGSTVGSAIVSGNGNIVYVIHQTLEKRQESDGKDAIGPNPYMGLVAFGEQDAERYFGREVQVDRLWKRLQALYEQSAYKGAKPRFLPILGPSGCGKSSLALAGLIPELARRPLPSTFSLKVAVLRPGSQPLEALAGVLAKVATNDPMPVTKTREFTQELSREESTQGYDGLRRIVALMPHIAASPLVLLVDQFEEIFSLCKDPTEQQAFIDNLLIAAADPAGYLSVVITLRSDFLGEAQCHPGLSEVIGSDQSVIVLAMTTEEVGRAIAEPAKQAGHPLDEATVEELVQDVKGREGALPLLQFALAQIWEGLRAGYEPLKTYQKIGRVGGALAGKAEEIYDRLSASEQAITERVFIALVQLGEGTLDTRRKVRITNLVTCQDGLEQVREVIHKFSGREARLITLSTADNEAIAEITHEALFDHWPKVKGWIDSRRDDIRFQRRLEEAAASWMEQNRPAGSLWRQPDLDRLRSHYRLFPTWMTDLQQAFYLAAIEQEKQTIEQERRRQQLKRLSIVGLAVGLVLTTGISAFATYQVRQAQRRQMQIYESAARTLAESDPLGSMVNGLAAIGLGRSPIAKLPQVWGEDLVSPGILDLSNRYARFSNVAGHEDVVTSVSFSPDGETIVSGGWGGMMQLWDRIGHPISTFPIAHENEVRSVGFSPDGETIISGGWDGMVRLWDRLGQPIAAFPTAHEGGIRSVVLSPDGETIVSGGDDGTVRLWDRKGQLIASFTANSSTGVSSVGFSPDGNTIISGGMDGKVALWNRAGQSIAEPFIAHGGSGISAAKFSPDGDTIVSSGINGTIALWNRSGEPISPQFSGNLGWQGAVEFSPNGEIIVGGGEDGIIRLWDLNGQLIAEPLIGHDDWISSVGFSPDGETVISSGMDGTVRLWNRVEQPVAKPFIGHDSWVNSVGFSPDGEIIVSAGSDDTLRLWDRLGQPVTDPLVAQQGRVSSVEFSPDGNTIVSSGMDGTVRLWNKDGQLIAKPFTSDEFSTYSVQFSPDGKILVSGGDGGKDGTVKLWDHTGQPITEPFAGHERGVRSVRFSPDGESIASGGVDGTVRLWDLKGQLTASPFIGHEGGVNSLGFSPNGESIVSGGIDGTIRLWNLTGQLMAISSIGHEGWVNFVGFSPNGETIISSGDDGTIRLWDLTGQPIIEPLTGHEFTGIDGGGVNYVGFSPDGKTIISGGVDGTVRLWPIDLVEVGWVTYTCNRIQGYLIARSETDATVRAARRTCER